jgi:hypothetical protein
VNSLPNQALYHNDPLTNLPFLQYPLSQLADHILQAESRPTLKAQKSIKQPITIFFPSSFLTKQSHIHNSHPQTLQNQNHQSSSLPSKYQNGSPKENRPILRRLQVSKQENRKKLHYPEENRPVLRRQS